MDIILAVSIAVNHFKNLSIMTTKHSYTKGSILTDKYDSVIKYQILSTKGFSIDGTPLYAVRKYSKYGNHGNGTIAEDFMVA